MFSECFLGPAGTFVCFRRELWVLLLLHVVGLASGLIFGGLYIYLQLFVLGGFSWVELYHVEKKRHG